MTDPRRLLDAGANEFEAKLLRAGRRDGPSARNRGRVLTGLGLGSILSASVAASAAKATTPGPWWSPLGLGTLRWVGGGAVSALAVWAGVEAGVHVAGAGNAVEANPRSASVSEPVAPNISVNELEPTLEPEPSATALAPPPEAPTKLRVARSTTPVRSAPADTSQGPSADSLSAELLALDQARAALVNGDAALALRSVDAYVRRFPKRRLDAEATVLRIESLVALGDHASATRIGRGFLARHSRGPYARRVNSLIGEPSVSGTSKR